MDKRKIFLFIVIFFLLWNLLTFLYFVAKYPKEALIEEDEKRKDNLIFEIKKLKEEILKRKIENKEILNRVQNLIYSMKSQLSTNKTLESSVPQIGVIVISCNRPTVNRIIQNLIKLRYNKEKNPIIVSQDCNHKKTKEEILKFKNEIIYLEQPNQTDFGLPSNQKHLNGYYKISRHYKFALNQAFKIFNFTAVIIVEDDLEISPDFYLYFSSTLHLLLEDPSLWCVSAWNDNGKKNLINYNTPGLLYRSDFFPGLGWMLTSQLWKELEPIWPNAYWDDWMRHPNRRKGRSCIRPEISRTSTFGKIGVSKGQFFEKHLKYIIHYNSVVFFDQLDLSYLLKVNYDHEFFKIVYGVPEISILDLISFSTSPSSLPFPSSSFSSDDSSSIISMLNSTPAYRLIYNNNQEYVTIAKKLQIMEDQKEGIPRMGYLGVVSVMYNNIRIFLCPKNILFNNYNFK